MTNFSNRYHYNSEERNLTTYENNTGNKLLNFIQVY